MGHSTPQAAGTGPGVMQATALLAVAVGASGDTLAVFIADTGEVASPSRLCFSCHDGTVSPNRCPNPVGSGGGLASGHPIGVHYATARSSDRGDHRLRSPTSPSGLGGSIEADLLIDGRLECVSCHDRYQGADRPHGALRLTTAGGRLCLTCHAK